MKSCQEKHLAQGGYALPAPRLFGDNHASCTYIRNDSAMNEWKVLHLGRSGLGAAFL
jgi:hypothetical protein